MATEEKLTTEPEPFTGRIELPEDTAQVAFISEAHVDLRNRIHYPSKNDPEPTQVERLTETILDRILTIVSAEAADFPEETAADESKVNQALRIANSVCEKARAGKSSVPAEE
jgi:hypothetical protein